MHRLSAYTVLVARVLISVVFVLNALGIIDQTIPARELAERGMPLSLVPAIMMSGRIVEFIAGIALALGIFPRLAAVALFGFLVPATFVSHSFWLAAGTPAFQGQLINFLRTRRSGAAFCSLRRFPRGLFFYTAMRAGKASWRKACRKANAVCVKSLS